MAMAAMEFGTIFFGIAEVAIFAALSLGLAVYSSRVVNHFSKSQEPAFVHLASSTIFVFGMAALLIIDILILNFLGGGLAAQGFFVLNLYQGALMILGMLILSGIKIGRKAPLLYSRKNLAFLAATTLIGILIMYISMTAQVFPFDPIT